MERPDHIQGFRMLRDMVIPDHQYAVDRLIEQEEIRMGMVSSDLDAAFEEVEAGTAPTGGGGLLPEGEYEGVVVSSEVGDSVKSWVTSELKLKLEVVEGERAGSTTFCDIELAPNEGKDGQPSPGKLKFVKGQLTGLGYTGKLSEVELNPEQFIGAKVKFRQKVDTHLDANGVPDQYAKTNPNTGQPYIDREVYLNELLTPGFGQASAASVSPSETTVY